MATLPQLRDELKSVVGWVQLGLCLRLSLAELQKIHRQKGGEGVRCCLVAMLELWVKSMKEHPPMWREVVEGLYQIGYTAVAKELAEKYSECRVETE